MQLSSHSCKQGKSKNMYSQKSDFIYNWFNLNKNKIDIYQEVLRDVSQNFENAKFIEMVQQFGVSKSTIIFKRSLLISTLR